MSSDPILGTLAYPCEACGVEAGQECLASCPSLSVTPEFADLELPDVWVADEVIDTPPLDESLAKLMTAAHRLPFSRLTGECPERTLMDTEVFVAALADWMTGYEQVARVMVDDLSEQSRQRISLQLERDIVTNYLKGTPL